MKIAIDKGHCLCGFDTSADGRNVGGFSESEYDRILGNKIIELLKQEGNEVIDVTVDDGTAYSNMYGSLADRVYKANINNVDLYFALHFNAGGGEGTEVYYAPGDSTAPICQRIQNNMVNLGFKNRGVKTEEFYVLVNSKSPALLLETCFCDNVSDKKLYDSLGVDKIAQAIVSGILNKNITITTTQQEVKAYPDNEVEQYEGCKVFLTNEAYKYNEEDVKDGIPTVMKGKDNIWIIDHFAIVDHVFCGYIKGIGNIPQPMYRTVKDTPSPTSEMKDNMYVKLINEVLHGNGSQWKGQRIDYSNYSHTKEYLVTKLAINDHSFEGYINGLGWIPVSYFKVVGYKEEPTKTEEVENKADNTENVSDGTQVIYQVVTGSYTLKENAEKQVENLKQKGIDSFIQTK